MRKAGIKSIESTGKENEAYHDIMTLFRIYRSVTWQMQARILQVNMRFQKEYGTDVDSFLESIYEAGMDLNDDNANIRLKLEAIQISNHFIKLINNAVDVMRQYHPQGEKLYWVLYYAYLTPHEPANVSEILDRLEPHFPIQQRINRATYFRWKNDAFKAVSKILWGYEEENAEILKYFQDNWAEE